MQQHFIKKPFEEKVANSKLHGLHCLKFIDNLNSHFVDGQDHNAYECQHNKYQIKTLCSEWEGHRTFVVGGLEVLNQFEIILEMKGKRIEREKGGERERGGGGRERGVGKWTSVRSQQKLLAHLLFGVVASIANNCNLCTKQFWVKLTYWHTKRPFDSIRVWNESEPSPNPKSR